MAAAQGGRDTREMAIGVRKHRAESTDLRRQIA
jgi:hypothetical protein